MLLDITARREVYGIVTSMEDVLDRSCRYRQDNAMSCVGRCTRSRTQLFRRRLWGRALRAVVREGYPDDLAVEILDEAGLKIIMLQKQD